jgi:hypothetical protein
MEQPPDVRHLPARHSPPPDRIAEDREEEELLLAYIRRVLGNGRGETAYRLVVAIYSGLSHDEASLMLKLRPGSSRVILARASERLSKDPRFAEYAERLKNLRTSVNISCRRKPHTVEGAQRIRPRPSRRAG